MRSFASVLLIVTLSLILAALLAYPAWELIGLAWEQPIHRVMHRIAMLASVLGFVWLFRRWKIFHRHALGFGLPRAAFWRQLAAGVAAGALLILPLIGALYALEIRAPRAGLDLTLAPVIKLVSIGLVTGLVVAMIEEVFFRGLLFTAVRRESGTAYAVVLPSLLYAALHFLGGRLQVPAEQIEWSSGLAVLGTMFAKYAHPAAIADSFLALFAVGVLLSLVRIRTRGIAACIGLHAAWVCIIAVVRDTTILQDRPASWLVGAYDGVLGWGALAWMTWMAMMTIAYLTLSRDARLGSSESLGGGGQRA
ncbi:MAG TPA: CPBP family intramembrane glutamic endopeptidase [Povalibacter sp.]|nr:CPBP family intramembrane glutamic endopeptidase [Povalibacter sp.]